MTVERWVLPSGRIATLDTSQPAAAVEESRRTLREGFGAVLENEDAPAAGGNQREGVNTPTPSEEQNVNESKATRHARAAKAPQGTIAADRRIVVEDVPADATVHAKAALEAATPRDVVRAEDEFAHLPIRIRRSSAGARVRVWRAADGSWWRQGGFIRIQEPAGGGGRAFVVTLYKGANEGDLRFMLRLVEDARAGKGFGAVWLPVRAEWADELTFSTGNASRPYADPYTHFDSTEDVCACDDDACGLLWHTESDDHELDSIVKRLDDNDGGYEIRVERPQDTDRWRVRVNADWFDGMPADVAGFVSDLQWMQAECERANKERAA